jgi:hypothetical protein
VVPWRCRWWQKTTVQFQATANQVYDEVFAVHQFWGEGFFHGMFESLPRLVPYVQFLNENPHIRIYCRSDNQLSTLFGIRDFAKRLIKEPNFGARVLYSPAGGGCGEILPTLTLQMTSFYAQRDLSNNPQERRTVVLVKRSKKRWFGNQSLDGVSLIEQSLQDMMNENVTAAFKKVIHLLMRDALCTCEHEDEMF